MGLSRHRHPLWSESVAVCKAVGGTQQGNQAHVTIGGKKKQKADRLACIVGPLLSRQEDSCEASANTLGRTAAELHEIICHQAKMDSSILHLLLWILQKKKGLH